MAWPVGHGRAASVGHHRADRTMYRDGLRSANIDGREHPVYRNRLHHTVGAGRGSEKAQNGDPRVDRTTPAPTLRGGRHWAGDGRERAVWDGHQHSRSATILEWQPPA